MSGAVASRVRRGLGPGAGRPARRPRACEVRGGSGPGARHRGLRRVPGASRTGVARPGARVLRRRDFDGWRAARAQALAPRRSTTTALSQRPGSRHRPGRAVDGSSGLTGVAAQVALARHESPVRGAQHVRLALAADHGDLPHTLAALEAGEVSEWRAQVIVTETATLTSEQRTLVDAEVVGPLVTPATPGTSASRSVPWATASSPVGSAPPRTASTLPRSWPARRGRRPSDASRSAPPLTRWPTSPLCSPSRRPLPRTPPSPLPPIPPAPAGDERGQGPGHGRHVRHPAHRADCRRRRPRRGPARHDRPGPARRRHHARADPRLRHRPCRLGPHAAHPIQ